MNAGHRANSLVLVCLVEGCRAMYTYRTPTVLTRGQSQVLLATQVHGASAARGLSAPMPELAGSYRRGLGARWEVSGSGTLLPLGGVIVGAKLGRHVASLSPMLSYQRVHSCGARPVSAPAAGFALGAAFALGKQWSLHPEVARQGSGTRNLTDGDSELFHVGMALGFAR